MKWERVQVKVKAKETPDGKKPAVRRGGAHGPGRKWGHTCNAVKSGRLLYVFGGYGRDDCQTNDVHVFDTTKQTWSKPMVKGTAPTPRDSHTCTTVGSKLFVFGGTDGNSPLKDLHILDTVTNQWSTPITKGDGPAAREGHSAALIGTRLFVFGGCGRSPDDMEETYFNDLYILETTTFQWTKAATLGTAPAPRDSHTCSSYRNTFIVLGGEDSSNSYLSDIYVLDADTLVWKELRTTGQKLIPRAGHTTVALGKYLFVFGGFTDDRKLFDDLHVLHVESGVWTKATTTGEGPSPRFSLAGDCADPEKGILLFLGGCNENLEALEDMYYLDTDMKVEVSHGDPKPEKLSLRKELKRKQQEQFMTPEKGKEGIVLDDSFRSTLTSTPTGAMSKMAFQDFKPMIDKSFEAKVTDVFHYGYSVETNIDGKQLRGLLFSYKPGYYSAVHNHLTKKKVNEEAEEAKIREARRAERRQARQAKLMVKRAAEAVAAANAIVAANQGAPAISGVVPTVAPASALPATAVVASTLASAEAAQTNPTTQGAVQIAEEHVQTAVQQ
ncbi:Rab9 effector protein with kelch motifs [Marchantia polymorpha subsp. ruderalis]